MNPKPIPAFYCCYLLRSTVRHASLYVGSTPNPARRLAQHNGLSKGGAGRTAKMSLRPWEMACIVTGFPSNIAALQFEWAWQNSHLTRHIPKESRPDYQTISRMSRKTGRTRNCPGRPIGSLTEKINNLHLLLRVPYFSKWPLTVRFFSEEVFRTWQAWRDRVDASIPSRVRVVSDFGTKGSQNPGDIPNLPERLKRLIMCYDPVKDYLQKSQSLLRVGEEVPCSICKSNLNPATDSIVVCSEGDCRSTSHMTCLAARFLKKSEDSSTVVPTEGSCPKCQSRLQWAVLMKEMTLRIHGDKEIKRLFRKRRGVLQNDREDDNDDDEDMDEVDQLTAADVAGEDVDPEDTDDTASVSSIGSDVSEVRLMSKFKVPPRLSMLVEDSE